jgi:acyl carrier protein
MISTFDRLRAILVKDYQLAPNTVTMQAKLESLGIDSLGVAELLFSIEDEYRVTLPPEPVDLNTVGEVVHYIDALVAGRKPVVLKPVQPHRTMHSNVPSDVSSGVSNIHAQASAISSVQGEVSTAMPSPHMQ